MKQSANQTRLTNVTFARPTFERRWYQVEAEDSIFEYFRNNNGNPVLALPTGTGKSVIIANFLKSVFEYWPTQRVMMLTHVKELIEQNADKLNIVWPSAPLGIYSAGLGQRDNARPIVFGGVQSVAPAMIRGEDFGHRDLLLIDECHLLSDKDDSHYQQVIAQLKRTNPNIKVIGFTATPYRMKLGMITENGIFTDICYDLTHVEAFSRLLAEGYLAPLVAKRMQTEIDLSNVNVVAGEYNSKQLERVVDSDDVVNSAVREMVQLGSQRKSWLVFATGIDNCEHLAKVIRSYGLNVQPVHSKLSAKLNTQRLNDFRAGKLRGIVSGQKLTTGFDHPEIDFIADMNPTLSVGKHVQKLGRGTRPAPGKVNCLYADFAGNVRRLGPINDPHSPKKAGKRESTAPVKICDECGVYNHTSARTCLYCGAEFVFASKLHAVACDLSPMRSDTPEVETFAVQKIFYNLHQKPGKPPCMRVSYYCGAKRFVEFVMLEHGGFAAKRSQEWWKLRHNGQLAPNTTYEALRHVSELNAPARIRVWTNKPKYPEILAAEWD